MAALISALHNLIEAIQQAKSLNDPSAHSKQLADVPMKTKASL